MTTEDRIRATVEFVDNHSEAFNGEPAVAVLKQLWNYYEDDFDARVAGVAYSEALLKLDDLVDSWIGHSTHDERMWAVDEMLAEIDGDDETTAD